MSYLIAAGIIFVVVTLAAGWLLWASAVKEDEE